MQFANNKHRHYKDLLCVPIKGKKNKNMIKIEQSATENLNRHEAKLHFYEILDSSSHT